MSGTPLFYMCSFNLGNFTYLYRCRIMDQYCCDHTCCFNQPENDAPQLFASWYFWSLIMVVLVVFGCIVISFALSGLKRKVDIESWSAFAGTAFNSLATTVIGKQGIIEPKLHYNSKPDLQQQQPQQQNSRRSSSNISFWNTFSTSRQNEVNPSDLGGISTISTGKGTTMLTTSLTEQQEEEGGTAAMTSSPDASSTVVTVTASSSLSSTGNNKNSKRNSLLGTSDWVEIQLTPLCPAYKSSWPGNASEQRIAASTQVFFPPGFINS